MELFYLISGTSKTSDYKKSLISSLYFLQSDEIDYFVVFRFIFRNNHDIIIRLSKFIRKDHII